MWMQLQIPKIEDGNNFGVAVQVGNGSRTVVLFSVLRRCLDICIVYCWSLAWTLGLISLFFCNRRKCLSCWPTHAPRSRGSKPRFQSKSLGSTPFSFLTDYILNQLLLGRFMYSNVTSARVTFNIYRLIIETSLYSGTIMILLVVIPFVPLLSGDKDWGEQCLLLFWFYNS